MKSEQPSNSSIYLYAAYNGGYFHDRDRTDDRSDFRVSGLEKTMCEAISYLLDEHMHVRILGLGEQMGFSMVQIAAFHRHSVLDGKLDVIVVNKEQSFEVVAFIEEAQRRLDVVGSRLNWFMTFAPMLSTIGNSRENIDFIYDVYPYIHTPEHLDWFREYYSLVTYHAGVDTVDIVDITVPHSVDIIHEAFGGLWYHEDKRRALQSCLLSLHESHGALVTNTPLQSSHSKFFHSPDEILSASLMKDVFRGRYAEYRCYIKETAGVKDTFRLGS